MSKRKTREGVFGFNHPEFDLGEMEIDFLEMTKVGNEITFHLIDAKCSSHIKVMICVLNRLVFLNLIISGLSRGSNRVLCDCFEKSARRKFAASQY
jgi:hypothetical protein